MPTVAIGNDGNITLPSGHNAHINSWTANVSRVENVITGFSDDAARRRLGVQDITGSASGFPNFGESGTAPGTDAADPGGDLTLTIATGCTLQAAVVLTSFEFGSSKTGDATLTFNFANEDGKEIVETWATS